MFDGLKDKLRDFTEDVEEEAAEAEQTDQSPEAATESGETTEGQENTANADGIEQESPSEETPAGSSQEDLESSSKDAETPSEESADGETANTEEGGDLGLTSKAKALATGKTIIEEEGLQPHLDELEVALLDSNVELEVTIEILNGIEENLIGEARGRLESTGSVVEDALREALYDVIDVGQFDFDQRIAGAEKPFVMVFTGVNGVGKTTSIAKLSRYLEAQGHSTVLANGDTYRAGANEQLQEHADALDRKLITHEQGSDPAAVIYDAVEYAEANDVDVVLGDTAGRLHTSNDLMDQLEKIDRVIDPDMTVFVDEAVAGQDAVNRADEFDKAATIDASILTKADADQDGGAAISVAHVTGKPILFLGTGQEYADLERFEPERIINELLGPE
jgi:fused signal recognition particle receptor